MKTFAKMRKAHEAATAGRRLVKLAGALAHFHEPQLILMIKTAADLNAAVLELCLCGVAVALDGADPARRRTDTVPGYGVMQ